MECMLCNIVSSLLDARKARILEGMADAMHTQHSNLCEAQSTATGIWISGCSET